MRLEKQKEWEFNRAIDGRKKKKKRGNIVRERQARLT